MLKPKPMSKISILGSKSVMENTVKILHEMSLLHIDEFREESDFLDIGAPLPESAAVSESLLRVRSMKSHLPPVAESLIKKQPKFREDVDKQVLERLDAEIKARSESLKSLDDEEGAIISKINELQPFDTCPIGLESFGEYSSIAVFVGYVSAAKKDALVELKSKAESKFPKSKMFLWDHEKKAIAALFVNIEKKEEAREFLSGYGYSDINLLPLNGLKGTSAERVAALKNDCKNIEAKKAKINAELYEISKRWLSYIREKESSLLSESEKAQAPLKFATTKNAFIVEGWIPKAKSKDLQLRLVSETGNKIYFEESKDLKDAPVFLENPKTVQPFEFFMNLYALPKYLEIDPTVLMFLTFPLFFGMMLGDIGYGIISLALFLALKSKFKGPDASALLNIMTFSALSTILFGLVFGEFFGEEELAGYAIPHIISRVHSVSEMLIITAAMGVVHINFGFILGFINKYRAHGFSHAVFEKGSWIVLEIGIALFAASYMGYIQISNYVGAIISILAVVMLFKGEGIKGIVEIPALLSNSLSYARIMAVGLASASLAIVVNELAGELFHAGGINMAFGVVILLIGHTINLALGILGPFLHSLRLHYVEFFTKFFEGGGKAYKPFGA